MMRMSGLEFIPLEKMQLLHMRENMLRWKEKRREIWKPLANGLCVKKSRFTALRKRRGDGDTISSQKKICRNEKWNCSMNYFFVPQEALYKQRLLRIE